MRVRVHLSQLLFGWAGPLHLSAELVGLGIALGWQLVASRYDCLHFLYVGQDTIRWGNFAAAIGEPLFLFLWLSSQNWIHRLATD